MTEPRLDHVQCLDSRGLHRMAYWEWGDAANPRVLVCVHGLSRQGRDFDTLATALCGDYRVVCPDVVGRGQSDWLADPMGYADAGLRGRHGHAAGAAGCARRCTGSARRWAG
jgi:pimeloyl-ACP methyl ester carboxylesterase